MTRWLNKNSVKANHNYTAPFEREKQLIELEELFIKFDFDGSGTLDLDELVSMFQMAGLRIPSNRLKNMFHLAKDAKIVKDEVDKQGFQRLMLSPELNKAFRVMLRDVRNRVKFNDFSLVDPDVTFLPTDLSLMLGYLYKRSIRNNLTEGIRSDKDLSTAAKSGSEMYDQLNEDLERFTGLFHLHDDASIDIELRRKYRIGSLEKQFRKAQNPKKRKEVTQLRAIATYFLNQIKQRAERHKDVGSFVEKGVLNHKIDVIDKDRVMKMESELDRKEISMANLHQIRKEREAKEMEKQNKKNEFGKILRALTVTKSNSQINLQSQQSTQDQSTVDFKHITDKEERGLYEMIASLQDNLEILDGVQEVFEREDIDFLLDGQATEEENESSDDFSNESDSAEGQKDLLGGIDAVQQKKVTMGKAVFISNLKQKEKELSEEEKIAKRNAMITQLMQEQTASERSGSADDADSVTQRDGYKFMKTNKQLFSEKIREPVKRNATSLIHRSQMSRPSISNVLLSSSNDLQADGRSVINKHQAIENHLQDQLKTDGQELLKEMLHKNQDNNLSDFQKQTLRHIRNSSQRSQMIIYGDCVSQLERMVNKKSRLYNSTETFPKLKKVEEQDSITKETDKNPLESTCEWTKEEKDGHIKISVNQSVTPKRARKVLLQNSESLFSTSHHSSSKAADSTSKFRPINKDLAKDLKGILAQSRHQAKVATQSHSELVNQKSMLLMSQQARLFASPISKRNQMAKGAVTSSAQFSQIRSANKMSTGINSDENTLDSAKTIQVLPAIIQSSNNSMSFIQENLFQSQPSTTTQKTSKAVSRVDMQIEETEVDKKISDRKFKRNFYASSDLRGKNLSSVGQKDNKPTDDYFSLSQSQQKRVDFNYAGYMAPLKPTAKEVRESFFNSHQDAAKNIAAAKSKSALIKKIVEKAKQGNHYKNGMTQSGEQKIHSDRHQVRQIHSVIVKNDEKTKSSDESARVPSTVKNIYSVPSGTETGSTPVQKEIDLTSQKIKKFRVKKSKSPAKKFMKNLSSVASLSKINITDPIFIKELPQPLKSVKQQIITVTSPSKLGVYPSISSLQLNSEKDKEMQEEGIPSLAAAQARSMSRKALSKIGNHQNSKPILANIAQEKAKNQVDILGVYGDALKRIKKPKISLPASEHNVCSEEQYESDKRIQMMDQSISGQQSLQGQSAFDKSALQESLVSESSGRRNHKPIYRGEVEPKRNLPSSSHNVVNKKIQNPDLEHELVDYGPIGVATSPEPIQRSGLSLKKAADQLGNTHFTNKTVQSFNIASDANQGQTIKLEKTIQKKAASPFQQFQDRIRKLQMYQPGATPSQMHPEYQQSTPIFRDQSPKKSTAQSIGTLNTGGAKKMLSQSKQSWSQNITVVSNNTTSVYFPATETRDILQSDSWKAAAEAAKRPPKAKQTEGLNAHGFHVRKKSSSKDQLPAMLGTKISITESKVARTKMSIQNNLSSPMNGRTQSLVATEIIEESRNKSRLMSSDLTSVLDSSLVSKERNQPSTLMFLDGATLNQNESKLFGHVDSSMYSGTLNANTRKQSRVIDQKMVILRKDQPSEAQVERDLVTTGEKTTVDAASSRLNFGEGQKEK